MWLFVVVAVAADAHTFSSFLGLLGFLRLPPATCSMSFNVDHPKTFPNTNFLVRGYKTGFTFSGAVENRNKYEGNMHPWVPKRRENATITTPAEVRMETNRRVVIKDGNVLPFFHVVVEYPLCLGKNEFCSVSLLLLFLYSAVLCSGTNNLKETALSKHVVLLVGSTGLDLIFTTPRYIPSKITLGGVMLLPIWSPLPPFPFSFSLLVGMVGYQIASAGPASTSASSGSIRWWRQHAARPCTASGKM